MCLTVTGTLASSKGTPCYIVIVVYYCGGHSKRKTLMMSTYNLTMANPAMVPRGGHGRIAPLDLPLRAGTFTPATTGLRAV